MARARKSPTPRRPRAKGRDGKPLARYRSMRDFAVTPEPAGAVRARREAGGGFVVQKHDATRLHWDFRLEMEGVLRSWAVPKGPSLDPKERRLAMQTEDHPLEYGTFEGVIPEKQYGAGPVILWDRGRWEPVGDALAGLRKGHLEFRLEGERMRGRWHLVRLDGKGRDDGRAWLLFKAKDEEARTGAAAEMSSVHVTSVESGRTIEQVAGRGGAAPAPRATPRPRARRTPAARRRSKPGKGPSALPGARRANLPERPLAELATLVEVAPAGDDWVHEIKYDGYRVLCRVNAGKARLITRNGKDWSDRFPRVTAAAADLPVSSAVVDAEVVRLDERGRSSFGALQQALSGDRADELVAYAFDLPYWDGYDLSSVPLLERKEALRAILAHDGRVLRYSDHQRGRGPEFHAAACEMGLEGIVSKRADSPYATRRTPDWRKVRCGERQEFVLVGWTPHRADSRAVGALLLGVHDDRGRLRYAGKVGTGFSSALRRDLRARLEAVEAPAPRVGDAPREGGVRWAEPRLVGEVRFTEWTSDARLRHPTFLGLREDKDPRSVVRERGAGAPPHPAARRSPRRTVPMRRKEPRPDESTVTVAGVRLSNPDRVLYPEEGITKRALAEYYEAIAERAVPEIAGRPLSLVRCPEGWRKECFYQKHPLPGLQRGVARVRIRERGGVASYMVAEDLSGVVSLVQLGVLEFHTWGSRADDPDRPDRIVLDLDPAPDVPFRRVVQAAIELRDRLRAIGLVPFAKTTGGKGLHVVVPLLRRHTWDEVKEFSHVVAARLAQDEPKLYLDTASKSKRAGRIFVDWLRNGRGATAVAAYSVRARERATVSTPLAWDEVVPRLDPRSFRLDTVPRRVASLRRDPWEGYAKGARALTAAARALAADRDRGG